MALLTPTIQEIIVEGGRKMELIQVWPDASGDTVRTNIRNILHVIKGQFGVDFDPVNAGQGSSVTIDQATQIITLNLRNFEVGTGVCLLVVGD